MHLLSVRVFYFLRHYGVFFIFSCFPSLIVPTVTSLLVFVSQLLLNAESFFLYALTVKNDVSFYFVRSAISTMFFKFYLKILFIRLLPSARVLFFVLSFNTITVFCFSHSYLSIVAMI